MTTPGGTISLSDCRNEFTGSNPVSLSQMYSKGGSQGSGTISLSDMRNRSAAIIITVVSDGTSGQQTATNGGVYYGISKITLTASASVTFSVSKTGSYGGTPTGTYSGTTLTMQINNQTSHTQTGTWNITAAGISFQCQITNTGLQ